MNPNELKYTKSHEWIKVDGDTGIIGISDFAQHELSDIVFADLPEAGKTIVAGDQFGVLESVKTASDIFSPVSGTILESNAALKDHPELINQDPYTQGWMIKIKLSNPSELDTLLSAQDYQSLIS